MAKALLLALALGCCVSGMAWLALAMKAHWQQLRGTQPLARRTVWTLRALGSLALLVSLILCLRADHASMAALVWVMSLIPAVMLVAFTLAWRPRWLSWLVAWVPVQRTRT